MKNKFLLPAVFVGLLQAVLLFLCMDLYLLSTESGTNNTWVRIFYEKNLDLFPGVAAVIFGGVYAAPMLLFSSKRNWLWYFLCSVGFFLLFVVFFFTVAYVLPAEIAYMPPELLSDKIPNAFAGIIFGLILLVFSFPYFVFAALAKLAAHLVFTVIWLFRWFRQRRAATPSKEVL